MFPTQDTGLLIIDDFENQGCLSRLGTKWRFVTDSVMGGTSSGQMFLEEIDGHRVLRMYSDVSLENNGGFAQVCLDLDPAGCFDARNYTGVWLVVRGNGESYNVHLKTRDVRFPWQSYRSTFPAASEWREIRLPFSGFERHRIDKELDPGCLIRLGLVAIGRAFTADVSLSRVGLYRDGRV